MHAFVYVWFCFTGPKCRGICKREEAVWRIQQNSILRYTKVSVLMLRLLTTHGLNVKSGFHCVSSYSNRVFRVPQWQTTCLFDCWWFKAWMWRHFFNTCSDVSVVQTVHPVGWNPEETGSTQTSPVNRLVNQCLIFDTKLTMSPPPPFFFPSCLYIRSLLAYNNFATV